MKVGLDSAIPPSAAQVTAAKAAGVSLWAGYLSEIPQRDGLYRPWTPAELAVVKAINPHPIAYTSGWDDPVAAQVDADSQGVRLCLDVERLIRDNGAWVQAWLDAAPRAGLYGGSGVHPGRRAAFHIAAFYPTPMLDPRATWPSWPRPATPCGWQWQNTHTEFGVGVDRSWLDDWFGGESMHQSQKFNDVRQWYAVYEHRAVEDGNLTTAEIDGWAKQIADDGSNEDATQQKFIDGSKLSGNYKLAGQPAPPVVPAGTTFTATVK